jgi:hypothetical protein
MPLTTQLILVDDLADGMELHADVCDNLDRVLARAGTVLTETHRRIFGMCGIPAVMIVRPVDLAPPSPEEIAARAAAEARLLVRFRKADLAHEPMRRIFDETIERTMQWAQWPAEGTHA